ncbi:MAG TPA: CoB--CoM heterodisulfide reductase iron-sulfur subunit A family protein [Methanosarcinaceae archaeon]|nr:CoB--CoM heterodisulfide reductase iron-sulfur subunit A family protein [Methanosarcinaceae archaeon]
MSKLVGAVAVAGGGVAGIQSAIDLANSGLKVYLIENSTSIGGKMAQLDKTFPTLDCSMCTLSPKLAEVARHPNIELLTYSEITGIEGEAGDFTVKVKKKATFVDPNKCTACGLCVPKCPVKVPDEYNEGGNNRKAIYLAFPQAVPRVYTIDAEKCLYLTKGKCGNCAKACENDAINYDDKGEEIEINVGSVILSTGFEPFDATQLEQYRMDHPDVVTSMQFERQLSSSGPFEGHITLSDGTHPKRIAWIQCIGSRSPEIGRRNCSSVCCMYATKEAMVAMEHDSELETTIFNIDVRAFGKGFEEFYQKAKNEKSVRFINSRPSGVEVDPNTNKLSLKYEGEDGNGTCREEFDMVVLSIGLTPSKSSKQLVDIANVEMDDLGFVKTKIDCPVETTRPGIFVSGAMQAPKDIPDTVADASGAASKASSLLSSERGKLVTEKQYPTEKEITDEIRTGVVVCRCGINIGSIVDVPDVVNYAKDLSGVVFAKEEVYACSSDSLAGIADLVKEHDLNRVVVASCTPRTHEPLFRETLMEAGLNPYMFELANIREHCSWVHQNEKDKATKKAKDIVRMSVSRANLLQPLYKEKVEFNNSGLVIGGGIAGMNATIDIADKGFHVTLVEKSAELGGLLNAYTKLQDGRSTSEVLEPIIGRVRSHDNITLMTDTELVGLEGSMGKFTAHLKKAGVDEEIQCGVAIIATGANELVPEGYFSYGKYPNIVTQSKLEHMIDEGTDAKDIVFIQCAGGRNNERPYCSRACCTVAMKNAIRLKEGDPDRNVYVLYRDIRTFGRWEDLYTQARELGVVFMRYTEDKEPEVGEKSIKMYDSLLNMDFDINYDLLALSAPLVAPETNEGLGSLFKVPLDSNKFFLEAHIKLRPVEFATEGVFLCGTAQAPKLVDEAVSQALAAASRACTILSSDFLETIGNVSVVDPELCIGCGRCTMVCPYKAPELKEVVVETEEITYTTKKCEINPTVCKGCGSCAAECPTGAITSRHYTAPQIMAVIKAYGEGL